MKGGRDREWEEVRAEGREEGSPCLYKGLKF